MNSPKLVGVTGGIGSGKSTVCKIFESLGVKVYYADDRGKALLAKDESLVKSVKSTFGNESYDEKGELNRQFLAKEVFSDPDKLKMLNALVHPAVAKDFESWVTSNINEKYLIKEAALMYETGTNKKLDVMISVLAPKTTRVERVLLRDVQRTEDQVQQIIAQQTDDRTRKDLSDFIINNDNTELLTPQVIGIHKELVAS